MAIDGLTQDLQGATMQKEEKTVLPSELAAFVDSIARTLTHGDMKDISNLTTKNIKGMNRAIVINKYLEELYGWRIIEIDELIYDKVSRSMSYKGMGGERLIKLFTAIKPEINAHTEQEQKYSRLTR